MPPVLLGLGLHIHPLAMKRGACWRVAYETHMYGKGTDSGVECGVGHAMDTQAV